MTEAQAILSFLPLKLHYIYLLTVQIILMSREQVELVVFRYLVLIPTPTIPITVVCGFMMLEEAITISAPETARGTVNLTKQDFNYDKN